MHLLYPYKSSTPGLDSKREQSVNSPFLSVLSASAHAEKPNQRDTSKVHVIL